MTKPSNTIKAITSLGFIIVSILMVWLLIRNLPFLIATKEELQQEPICQYGKGILGVDKNGKLAVKKEYLLCSDFVPKMKSSGEYETILLFEEK